MTTVVQLVVSGVAMGFIYGLIAVGITLIWNAAGMLNFSNGQVTMLAAYLFGVVFIDRITAIPAAIVTIGAIAVFGVLIAVAIFIPLRNMNRLCTIMATIMLGKILTEVIRLVFGSVSIAVTPFVSGTIQIGDIAFAKAYVYIIIVGVVVSFALQFFLSGTKPGRAMQCVSQNRTAAALMGINVGRYMKYTSAMAFAIAAIVGILIIPLFDLSMGMTNMVGLKGFASAVVGGFGFLPGALAGGIIIGIVENFGGMLISAGYKDAIAFLLLIVFLLINPRGLTGLLGADKIKPGKKLKPHKETGKAEVSR